MKVGMQKSWLSVIDEWDQIDLISPVFSCLLGPRADPNHRQILQLSPITIHYFDWRTVFVDAKVAFIILNPEFCCWKIPTFADSRLWSIRVGFNCCEGIPHEGHGSTGRLGNRRHSQAAGHLKPRHIWHFHGSLINFHGIWCCSWGIWSPRIRLLDPACQLLRGPRPSRYVLVCRWVPACCFQYRTHPKHLRRKMC